MHALIDGDKIWIDINGYSRHGNDKYVHRTVAEQALGRSLKGEEGVHHINGNKSDNRNQNLVIFPDNAYHRLLHQRAKILDLGGLPERHKYCSYHQCLHNRDEFSTRPSSYDGLHNMCRAATNEYRKVNGYTLRKNRKPKGGD